jgi:antitoxin component of RelBE/YafQ-DinJ toxin-antitoxin module
VSPRGNLTDLVKARVDAETKAKVAEHCERSGRTEGAVVRLALREFLAKPIRYGKAK